MGTRAAADGWRRRRWAAGWSTRGADGGLGVLGLGRRRRAAAQVGLGRGRRRVAQVGPGPGARTAGGGAGRRWAGSSGRGRGRRLARRQRPCSLGLFSLSSFSPESEPSIQVRLLPEIG